MKWKKINEGRELANSITDKISIKSEKEVMRIWNSWVKRNGFDTEATEENEDYFDIVGLFFDLNDDGWCVKVIIGESVDCNEKQWDDLISKLDNCEGIDEVLWEDKEIKAICYKWRYEPLGGQIIPFDDRFEGAFTKNDWIEYNTNIGI